MRIDILTLFPDMFMGAFEHSILRRAQDEGLVEIHLVDFRKYSLDPHHKVDDTPYGGGCGMVLSAQPIFDCIDDIRTEDSKIILLTPDGVCYHQKFAYDFSKEKHLILICGHYEGFDERIRELVDMEISIGDYVLTGGEIPSMILVDSTVRLLDGVIKEESYQNESFQNQLLDYPVYTRPVEFMKMKVPEVLLSGHHENIKKWRLEQQIKRTKKRRPDLLEKGDINE